jgi:hypothetical protein
MDYIAGIGAVAVLWLIYGVSTGRWNPGALVTGADGRASTSKLQWLAWTVVVIFSYVAIYVARAREHQYQALDEVPRNVLIALGLSAVTMSAAKAITVSYISSNKVQKTSTDAANAPTDSGQSAGSSASGAVNDDSGFPDLSKIQMLAWTVIAAGAYLITVGAQIGDIHRRVWEHKPNTGVPGLPDIDASLMVLMGLAQGAYLGKKLVTTDTPRLVGLSPTQGKPGTLVTLTGQALGAQQFGSQITIDGVPVSPDGIQWKDDSIVFAIPSTQAGGVRWSPPQRIAIGANIAGQASVNPQTFTITST